MSAISMRPWWSILWQCAVAMYGGWPLDEAERPVHPHHTVYIGL